MGNENMKHKIVTYRWLNGVLKLEEHMVLSFEHALLKLSELVCDTFNVYDVNGALVHAGSGKKDHDHTDSYA